MLPEGAALNHATHQLLNSIYVANSVGVGANIVTWEQIKVAEAAEKSGFIERKGSAGYFLTTAGVDLLDLFRQTCPPV